jgi:hypothetical protein
LVSVAIKREMLQLMGTITIAIIQQGIDGSHGSGGRFAPHQNPFNAPPPVPFSASSYPAQSTSIAQTRLRASAANVT